MNQAAIDANLDRERSIREKNERRAKRIARRQKRSEKLQALRGDNLPNLQAAAKQLKMMLVPLGSRIMSEPDPRYQCPECENILDEGETRCSDCNKFARKLEGLVCICPECEHPITEDEL